MKLELLPPRPEKKVYKGFNLYVSVAEQLDVICKQNNTKFSYLMRHLINRYLIEVNQTAIPPQPNLFDNNN